MVMVASSGRGIVGTVDAEVSGIEVDTVIPEPGREEDPVDDLLEELLRAVLLDGVERPTDDIVVEVLSGHAIAKEPVDGDGREEL